MSAVEDRYLTSSVSCGPCTNMPLFKNSSGLCIKQTYSCIAFSAHARWGHMVVGSFIFTYVVCSVKAVGSLHVQIDSFLYVVAV